MTHLDHLAGRDAGASFPPALPALTRHHRLPQELTPAPTARSPRVPKSGFQLSFWGQGSSCQQYCGWQRGSRELKHPQNHPASPQTPISSRDTLEHLSPGCPQVPAQVLMKFVAMLGEVRLPRRTGLPAPLWAEVTPREEMQTKAQPRGRKGDPALGLGPDCGVHTHFQRLGRDRWHLNTGDLKSIFSSQEPKPHPHGPVRGTEGTPAWQRGSGQGRWSCP